jgi:hypothetical protein
LIFRDEALIFPDERIRSAEDKAKQVFAARQDDGFGAKVGFESLK